MGGQVRNRWTMLISLDRTVPGECPVRAPVDMSACGLWGAMGSRWLEFQGAWWGGWRRVRRVVVREVPIWGRERPD